MDSRKALLPALLAVSGTITATQAGAIELGEINVQSALGQPLRASVAYALQPNEQLADYCVSVQGAKAATGMPSINAARVSLADGSIRLSTTSIVNEPMSTLRISVSCPNTPNLVREFMIFLDPATGEEPSAALVRTPSASTPAPFVRNVVPSVAAQRRASAEGRRNGTAAETSVDAGERYRVQPGDTLSEIAQRIDNRSVDLWTSVSEIFAANPNAFIDNNPNRLKAGAWISIPASAYGDAGPAAADTADRPVRTVSSTAQSTPVTPSDSTTATGTDSDATYDLKVTTGSDPGTVALDGASVLEPATSTGTSSGTAVDSRDGGAYPDVAESFEIGDVVLEPEPATAPATAADATSTDSAGDVAEPGSSSWGWWFGGGALLLLGGLVLFGRRRAPLPTSDDTEPRVEKPKRYLKEAPTLEVVETTVLHHADAGANYDLEDDSPTEENLVIDADLEHGTGLDADVDVSEDFSFASTTELDIVSPAESAVEADHTGDDDADYYEPTVELAEEPTVEQVAVKEDHASVEDDYDMSVIFDATKMPDTSEVTERDLHAIVVDGTEEEPGTGAYTVSKEVDYQILEQGFEDELTPTQALNMEIERAAAELAERMVDDEVDPGETIDRVAAQLATVTPIDATGQDSDHGEPDDDTALPGDDETAEMPMSDSEDDITAEMPAKTGKGAT